MWSSLPAGNGGRTRRWLGVVVYLAALGVVAMVVPRLGSRSPATIVLLCALAVLTMKLVERQIRRAFDRWAEREATRRAGPR